MPSEVVVVGHIGRDLVVQVGAIPDAGTGAAVHIRLELPGGKGANQAVNLAQLGYRPALIGAVGDDPVGDWLRQAAADDGIDIDGVVTRRRSGSSLIVSIVDQHGSWRYLEDLTPGSFLTAEDMRQCASQIRSARAVSLQLQQSWEAIWEAARMAADAGALLFVDGTPPEEADPSPLFALADVWRSDRREAERLTGLRVDSSDEAVAAARLVRERGPGIAAVASGEADVILWAEGQVVIPHQSDRGVVDTTGGGDAFMAGLITGLLSTGDPVTAGCLAAAAARQVVGHLGGRPHLQPDRLRSESARLQAERRV